MPDDLALVLKKNKPAADFFAGLSFTNRKEYVEWVVSAKQDTTRKNRVEGSFERLIMGWKNPRNL
ncbi:MAG: YdeI/OmpD-associated family protein [Bacteroidota bacterium]